MFGGSYVGATQMLAAIARPPHLAGICPFVTGSNYHSNWTYQGGAFQQWFNESWTSGLAQNAFNRDVCNRTNATKGIWQLPLGSFALFNDLADGGVRLDLNGMRRTTLTGSRIRARTRTGSSGPSRRTSRRSPCRS